MRGSFRRLVERFRTNEASRATAEEGEAARPELESLPHEEREQIEETPEPAVPEPAPEPPPEPVLAVSKQSARAILATGPPPVSEPLRPEPKARMEPEPEPESDPEPERDPDLEPEPEPEPEPEAEPEPEPEPEPALGGPPREWSIWDLQQLIRERPDDTRQEEWAALLHSLRDFARTDGMLPVEFDELVRESFGSLLTAEEPEEAAVP